MSARWREACRSVLSDRVFILIHPRPSAVGKHGARTAILCDGTALRGWVPVTDRGSSKIVAQFFAQMVPAPSDDPFRQPIDDLDDDHEDE